MNDFSQLLWAKVPKLAIDGHTTPDVNRDECGIAIEVLLIKIPVGTCTVRDRPSTAGCGAGCGQHFDLIWFIQAQRKRCAARIPFPLAEGDKAHSTGELF